MKVLLFAVLCCSVLSAEGTVDGKVIDSVTQAGIPGVTVSLVAFQKASYDTKTDSSGAFRIAGMQDGSYRVSFIGADYNTDTSAAKLLVQVSAGQVARVTYELDPWATVSGRVLDVNGEPVARAKVFLRDPLGQAPGAIDSAADGSFRFDHLRMGTYTLSARPVAQPGRRTDDKLEVVETYFPNAIEEDQAAKISLKAGTTIDGYNIRLQRAPVFSVRGIVRDADGKPVSQTKVLIGKRRTGGSIPGNLGELKTFHPGAESLDSDAADADSVETGADGAFEFPRVSAGDWIVQGESEWIRVAEKDVQQVGYGAARLSDRDVRGIEIQLARTFDFGAKVEIADESKPPPDGYVSLLLRPSAQGRYIYGMQEGEFGSVTLKQVVPGRYRVVPGSLGALNGLYVSAVYLGGVNVTGQEILLTESSPPLRAVFKKGVGTVRGTVAGSAATLVAIPAAGAADSTILALDVTPGVEFQLPGLAPGDYTVGAFDRVDGAHIFAPGTLQRLMTLGSTVKLDTGGTASVELRVNRWPE